jgi:hypothetical protein
VDPDGREDKTAVALGVHLEAQANGAASVEAGLLFNVPRDMWDFGNIEVGVYASGGMGAGLGYGAAATANANVNFGGVGDFGGQSTTCGASVGAKYVGGVSVSTGSGKNTWTASGGVGAKGSPSTIVAVNCQRTYTRTATIKLRDLTAIAVAEWIVGPPPLTSVTTGYQGDLPYVPNTSSSTSRVESPPPPPAATRPSPPRPAPPPPPGRMLSQPGPLLYNPYGQVEQGTKPATVPKQTYSDYTGLP